MNIKWNEYTWYSKLLAAVFFIIVLPIWTFYLGSQYARTQVIIQQGKEASERVAQNPIQTHKQTTTSDPNTTGNGSITTFTSQKLGVTFNYAAKYGAADSPNKISAVEKGNKIYVYDTINSPEQGQSVEVFSKPKNQSFADAIREQFLKNYPFEGCKVDVKSSSRPNVNPTYQYGEISYPPDPNYPDAIASGSDKCNPNYAQTNGVQYFWYDPAFPEKFFFFRIGQYAIMADENQTWQDTFKVLK